MRFHRTSMQRTSMQRIGSQQPGKTGKATPVSLAFLVAILLPSTGPIADVWVFEPSAAIDQRVDTNYTIDPDFPDAVNATRLVGTIGVSREAPSVKFSGLARLDGLITQSDLRDNDLTSNQILFLNSRFFRARSEYGIGLNIKRDTPSRDISADITDISSVAADTGASVTQDQNVARLRYLITPNWRYNLTRRTSIETDLSFTQVEHELPSAQDTLDARWAASAQPGDVRPDPVTIEDTQQFTVLDELDDFREVAINVGVKTKLSPISTLSFFAGFSDFTAESEPNPDVIIPFEEKIPDDDVPGISRNPKREARSNTATFRIGYDRAFTQTLLLGFEVGFYSNETDETDLARPDDDFANDEIRQAALAAGVTKNSGFLANITATKSTGLTRYSFKFGVDVLPSDVGSQVESLEAVGDLFREVKPLLDFTARIRAYEPDALSPDTENEFARRFLSIEPKLIWRFSRAWTVAGSYRYRRQKSQVDTRSGESNAVLFSLKYTPPSAIRDAELAK